MIDLIALIFLRCFIGALNALPYRARLWFLTQMVAAVFTIFSSHRRVAMRNLAQAFPDKTEVERANIFRQSLASLARAIVDAARLPMLDADWVKQHVEFSNKEEIRELCARYPIVVAAGHIGSIELQGHAALCYGFPISFVARNFTLPRVDAWWKARRERLGNRAIDRKGAVRVALREVRAGRVTVFLFDQNITRKHAVFVDFFGCLAATTRSVAVVALETRAMVLVVSLTTVGVEQYRLEMVPCDCQDIYDNDQLPLDEKIKAITARASKHYESMIRNNPGEWFWIHRRWKTVPEGESANFYE